MLCSALVLLYLILKVIFSQYSSSAFEDSCTSNIRKALLIKASAEVSIKTKPNYHDHAQSQQLNH